MNKELRQAWIEELKSRDRVSGILGKLTDDGMAVSALGALANLYMLANSDVRWVQRDKYGRMGVEHAGRYWNNTLPIQIRNWAGMSIGEMRSIQEIDKSASSFAPVIDAIQWIWQQE